MNDEDDDEDVKKKISWDGSEWIVSGQYHY